MKRLIFFLIMLIPAVLPAAAQKDPVDAIFDKYSGQNGITTVFVSGRMLNLISDLTQEDQEMKGLLGSLTSIRIISVDHPSLKSQINLYKEINSTAFLRDYEELMVIHEGTDIIKFMIKEKGDKISELIMVSEGTSSSLISIRGDIDLKSISSLSKSMGIEQLENLEKIEKEQGIKK